MSMIAPGTPAPDFVLDADDGTRFRLSEHRGRPVVLVFYPQDDTEGCTVEMLEFSALAAEFAAEGAVVVGISPDPVASHCAFRDKFALAIPLLADPDLVTIKAFGVWGEKQLYGRVYEGLIRTSVLVNAEGQVRAVTRATRIKGHAAKMLAAVRALP
ncbi:peroxiredoxin Q/BCP [Devosia enhydra]|uniref:thioredoxin-dependent peroxiredoxin n=1 Tax=Devosia enhydra TaxID=665118 RepID=A0A1K2HVG9_9HYPH|nr:peroxiredoxin [Devosia enhydra]SFZ82695.1 peroxiredoxin Q/BCP [Devosia enhydra]